ncbi:hypothetical protein BY996DRAFT_4598329 [Phakopsora pachyrhizi]|uniref:Uncharacterized protein n=1 Tax=Phakopsora pachyrhizi TaxID=170000 RepID=A0AAV0B9T8_PHAPC|nr:hypothetical protein BY996DRAFT_4598329 [Phakopsora pachyrhizi]CAH7683957.1 hypothetical protein PPACK8108_LOCUS17818 [Phakopsora pachyrhizi]CAH7684545.1 hypothetical protein PPACK8108_LOCUS18772 [Phakopsora pachyrhizi]
MGPYGASSSFGRNYMFCHGHPPVCSVNDLVQHGEVVLNVIKERGEENEELVKLYESGRAGQHIPQGSIKSFRQYADYMTLSSLPIWPITPVKVSLFLLFRLLMGDVTNGTPLRNAYLRSLARSLEHYREETAKYFISRWPEAGGWIIRDGRGDPESRNDITHDILRICKLGQHRPIKFLLDLNAVQRLVTGNNSALTPDAWATRRRLSARWVRDRDSANLPERQYAGGKFIGEPPKPPPLSARSTHWNRHLHDLREKREDCSWVPSASAMRNERGGRSLREPILPTNVAQFQKKRDLSSRRNRSVSPSKDNTSKSIEKLLSSASLNHLSPMPLTLDYLSSPNSLSSESQTPSLQSARSTGTDDIYSSSPSRHLAPIIPLNSCYYPPASIPCDSPSPKCVLPSLAQAGLHPSYFPLPQSPGLLSDVVDNRFSRGWESD